MTDLVTLAAIWLLSRCRGSDGGAGSEYEPALPGGQPGWPGSPISSNTVPVAPSWPAAAASVPPFPGPAWEFDEPPPAAVKARAAQLVDQLWLTGTGSFRIEQTAGRTIAYQAQVVASGKKGVVAYRIRNQRALPAASAARPAPRPQPRAKQRPPERQKPSASSQRPSVNVQVGPAVLQPASYPPGAVHPGHATDQSTPRGAPRVEVVPSALNLPTLKKGWGMKPAPPHKDVVLLQQRLGINADGRFGPGTDAAVRTFQRRNGLSVDGIVGQKTWAALFAVRA